MCDIKSAREAQGKLRILLELHSLADKYEFVGLQASLVQYMPNTRELNLMMELSEGNPLQQFVQEHYSTKIVEWDVTSVDGSCVLVARRITRG